MTIKIKNENEINFLELSNYIYNDDYQKIDKWFKKCKVLKDQELENYVVKKIIHEIIIGSFFLLPFITDDALNCYNDIERIKRKTKREIAILKNLSFKNQLQLLFRAIDEVNSDHFKVIKLTPKNKKFLESNENIVSIITKKFITEDFTEIDKIQEILGFNVIDQKSSIVRFYFYHKNLHSSFGARYLQISKPIFSPKCGIIFAYSEEKRKFLEERNIALPTIEKADILYHEMKKSIIHGHINDKYIKEKLDQSFKEYKIIKLNIDLENKLQVNDFLKEIIKI